MGLVARCWVNRLKAQLSTHSEIVAKKKGKGLGLYAKTTCAIHPCNLSMQAFLRLRIIAKKMLKSDFLQQKNFKRGEFFASGGFGLIFT